MKIFAVLCLSIILSSCSLFKDETPPEITLLSPTDNQQLNGVITFKVFAQDDEEINKVTLYINDDEYASINENKTNFQFEWDSDQHDNGEYTAYCSAEDGSGNISFSQTIVFVIENYRKFILVNNCPTPIKYTINDEVATIQRGDTIVYDFIKNSTFNLYGVTENSHGINFYWDEDFTMFTDITYKINLNSNYFLLIMKNSSSYTFSGLWVNYQYNNILRYESIWFPPSIYWYNFGFYEAKPLTDVYLDISGTTDEFYYSGTLQLPMTDNQKYYLTIENSMLSKKPFIVLPTIKKQDNKLEKGSSSIEFSDINS
jgi:hypothetical protein